MFIFKLIYLFSVFISGSVVLFHSGEFVRALYNDDRKLGNEDIAAFLFICSIFIFLPIMNTFVAMCVIKHYLGKNKQRS